LRDEVRIVLETGGTPLVLVEGSLGRAQEILMELAKDGHKLVASRSIFRWNNLFNKLGLKPADCRVYSGRPDRGSVLVYPMRSRGLAGLGKIRKLRKIACSGQSGDAATCRRLGVDRLVPFVDHIDFDGLVELVRTVRPKKVLTVFGYAETLARELNDLGFDAEPLADTPQLGFDF
jgi:Cft2 family RNA processing exonuclease